MSLNNDDMDDVAILFLLAVVIPAILYVVALIIF